MSHHTHAKTPKLSHTHAHTHHCRPFLPEGGWAESPRPGSRFFFQLLFFSERTPHRIHTLPTIKPSLLCFVPSMPRLCVLRVPECKPKGISGVKFSAE